jgi:hypothetical protein
MARSAPSRSAPSREGASPRRLLLVAIAAASLVELTAALCVITQDSPTSMPRPTLPSERQPHANPVPSANVSIFNACPQYDGAQCCSSAQNEALFIRLSFLEAAFGNPESGGCPSCFANT